MIEYEKVSLSIVFRLLAVSKTLKRRFYLMLWNTNSAGYSFCFEHHSIAEQWSREAERLLTLLVQAAHQMCTQNGDIF